MSVYEGRLFRVSWEVRSAGCILGEDELLQSGKRKMPELRGGVLETEWDL